MVDAAQLAPHFPLKLAGPRGGIDYLVLSAHKMYAPFGIGVLIGPHAAFCTGTPAEVGGGTVLACSREQVVFAPPPERDEAGTPNLIGAYAFAVALNGSPRTT